MPDQVLEKELGPYTFIYNLTEMDDKWAVTGVSIDIQRTSLLSNERVASMALDNSRLLNRTAGSGVLSNRYTSLDDAKGDIL